MHTLCKLQKCQQVNKHGVLKKYQNTAFLMDSRVSSNYTHDVHGPSTPKKRSTEKLIAGERLWKEDRFESLCMLRYQSWQISILWCNVLG